MNRSDHRGLHHRLLLVAATYALLLAWAPAAEAQQAQQAVRPAGQEASPFTMRQENLTLAKDSVRLRSARPTDALPNDTLRFFLAFRNTQDREVRNVAIDNPLPVGLVFLGGSVVASGAARVEYSIDNGVTYSAQPMVKVVVDGQEVERPADPASYTHIRWTILEGVAPGAAVNARFDARVGLRPAAAVRQ
jgi:uncharacterized repeat protein (TIGR01451 family)